MTTCHHGRIIQDGQPVASVSTLSEADMRRELLHYARQYAQDGPVRLEHRSGKSRWRELKQ